MKTTKQTGGVLAGDDMTNYIPKKELDLKFEMMDQKIESYHRETMETLCDHNKTHMEILEQTKTTNGRVKSLELWRATLAGAVAVLSLLLVPILISVLKGLI